MKRHLSLPLVETLRVLAISRGITARSSAARAALAARDDIPPEVAGSVRMLRWFSRLVLRQQIATLPPGASRETG